MFIGVEKEHHNQYTHHLKTDNDDISREFILSDLELLSKIQIILLDITPTEIYQY